MKFEEKLQKLRKEKGLSQEALAEMNDVSRQAVSKWESGQSYPETEKIIALTDIFGVTVDSLIKKGELKSDSQNMNAAPFWFTRGSVYEYKSKRTLWGLPLVHVHVGNGLKKAKGIIAIGNISTGILSIGLAAQGLISIGLLSLGLISVGTLSIGLLLSLGAVSVGTFSIGAVAVGVFTLGALSVGVFSTGACAVASHIAIGHHAYGHIAVGKVTNGAISFIDNSAGYNVNFATINADKVREAITGEYPGIWKCIVDWMTWFLG